MKDSVNIFSSSEKIKHFFHEQSLPNVLFIKTLSVLNILDIRGAKVEIILPTEDWSCDFNCYYSTLLKALVAVSKNKNSLLVYKKNDTESKLLFKEKPKKYSFDEKIEQIYPETESLKFHKNESIYNLSDLLSLENLQTKPRIESISEILNFLKIENSVTSNQLIEDRFLCIYKNGLSIVDVDFNKVVYDEKLDGDEALVKIICFDNSAIFCNKKNEIWKKEINISDNTTLASTISANNTQKISPENFYKKLCLPNLKKLLLGEFKSINRQDLIQYLSKHISIENMFDTLNNLFSILKNVNPFVEKMYFEELLELIFLLIDSKFLNLLLKSQEQLENYFQKLQKVVNFHQDFINKMSECDYTISNLLEEKKQNNLRKDQFGVMPAPWDEYSIQAIKM